MLGAIGIPLVGLLHLLAIVGAFFLGRMHERPRKDWEDGGLLDFGWAAWKLPFQIIVGASAFLAIALPMLDAGISGGGGLGGLGLGLGLGGGGGRGLGRRGGRYGGYANGRYAGDY